MSNSCFGPSFVDLKIILNTTMDNISLMTAFFHLSFMMGSLFGFLYKYIDRQIILITLLLIKAGATFLIPYSQQLWHLYLFIGLYGLGSGAWNSGNRVWVLEMFPKPTQSGAVLHLSGFMYGMGTILGPMIERPYLTGNQELEHKINYVQVLNNFNNTATALTAQLHQQQDITDVMTIRRYKLQKPFFIFGVIHLIDIP
ncbi:sodium-dependent glucose transporter 1A-like [Oppia nitens]|uniref:sodium-dependent glucose transporter 1A-like n=1 Tax=Oppia nitens TaxID=1686743 RepID=UPI0023DADB95|nr:sodium-dependent glucose transporter 1A-like [Oppia nitens]